jgi:hypothetical protein
VSEQDSPRRTAIGGRPKADMPVAVLVAGAAVIAAVIVLGFAGYRTLAIWGGLAALVLVAAANDVHLSRARGRDLAGLRKRAPGLAPEERGRELRRLERRHGERRTAVRELRAELDRLPGGVADP